MNTDHYRQVITLAENAGLSVTKLCRLAGVSPATVSRWRLGETQPSFRIWQKIEQAAKDGDTKKAV